MNKLRMKKVEYCKVHIQAIRTPWFLILLLRKDTECLHTKVVDTFAAVDN